MLIKNESLGISCFTFGKELSNFAANVWPIFEKKSLNLFAILEGQVHVSPSTSNCEVFVWVRFDGRLIRFHIFFGLACALFIAAFTNSRLPRWFFAQRGFAQSAQSYMLSNCRRIWILKLSGVKNLAVASLIICYHWSTFWTNQQSWFWSTIQCSLSLTLKQK